jgi:hypothetical protein
MMRVQFSSHVSDVIGGDNPFFFYLHDLGHALAHISQVLAFSRTPRTDEFCVCGDFLVQSLERRVDVLQLTEPFVDILVVATRGMNSLMSVFGLLRENRTHAVQRPRSGEERVHEKEGEYAAKWATAALSASPPASIQLRPGVPQQSIGRCAVTRGRSC